MSEPTRILHVLGKLNRGGAESMVMNIYRNIDRSKIQFDFIIHTEEKCDYTEEILNLGGKIYSVPRYCGKNHFEYINKWNEFFKNHSEYKIIHGHVRSTAAIYIKIAKKYGIKTISHSHNTNSGSGISGLIKNLLQYPIRYRADYLFACSQTAGEWLFGKRACEMRNFKIIKNAIDTKKFIYDEDKRRDKRKELMIGNEFVIGHIGRFEEQKNHDFLIDIFYEFNKIYNDSVLILIGKGEGESAINDKVKRLNIENKVKFLGSRDDIPELLQCMDLFILPSKFEGLPVVLVEAQAAGLRILASDSITKEVDITSLIDWLPINRGEKVWVDYMSKYKNDKMRLNMYEKIITYGYDIFENVRNMEKFYLSLSNKSGGSM